MFVFAAFISLLDNYESDTGEPEIVTPEEVAENHKFLDSIIQTSTMKVSVAEFWKLKENFGIFQPRQKLFISYISTHPSCELTFTNEH